MSAPSPATFELAIDLTIFTIRDGRLAVLLIERGTPPFQGRLALPGGFVRDREEPDAAATRELSDETGLTPNRLYLEQVRTYASPGRDPRGRVATVAYLAIAPDLPVPVAGAGAAAARWFAVGDWPQDGPWLAFDHDTILRDALERARAKLEYTPLATEFCGETFTIGELRRVYEAVWGVQLDPRNFNRKVTTVAGFVESTGDRRYPRIGRPAALYQRGGATLLYPPMLRPDHPARTAARNGRGSGSAREAGAGDAPAAEGAPATAAAPVVSVRSGRPGD